MSYKNMRGKLLKYALPWSAAVLALLAMITFTAEPAEAG
jgi:hypothetical protein